MKLSIIIPNYNGKNLLQKNVPFVVKAIRLYMNKTKQQAEILIIDDKSTDESVNTINQLIKTFTSQSMQLTLIQNEKNLGFSPTINKAVSKASGDIIFLMNSDVRPHEDFLLKLIPHFDDNTAVFAVGCLEESLEDGKTILRGRGVGKWERGLLVHKRGEVNKENTLWVNGGSGAYRKKIWDRIGGFNELYAPYYWEDIDLSYRAQKAGYRIAFEPKSLVIHEHEQGSIKKTQSPIKVQIIAQRNQFLFSLVNISDADLFTSFIFWLPIYFLQSILGGNKVLLLGLLRAFLMIPKAMQSRISIQKFTKRTDREVIKEFLEESK